MNEDLNDIGLMALANDYIAAANRDGKLHVEMHAAKARWEGARSELESVRRRMGEQTKALGRDLIIQIDQDTALLIPKPRDGYSDTSVYPDLHPIRGLAKLQK